MGLLDIVPLGSEMKAATSGVIGAGMGSLAGFVWGRYGPNKELKLLKKEHKSLKERIEELESRLGNIDQDRQTIAVIKVSIMRQLAWRDGKLKDAEKLFIYEYIMKHPDLEADVKVEAMHEVSIAPTKFSNFMNFLNSNKKKLPVLSSEQVDGFESTLMKLASCDGVYDKREEQFIKKIIEACS